MESFTTTCTTCGRRLRVRSASLIGQIVSCPKCGGMVQIAEPSETASGDASSPPQRVSVGPAGEVDSQAITRDSIDGEKLHASTLADPQQTAAGAVFNDAPLNDAAVPGRAEPPPVSGAAADPAASEALPVGWQSDRTRRARQYGLFATLLIAGVVAAAVAFLFFVQRWKENQTHVADSSVPVVEPSDEASDVSATEPDEPADEADDEAVVDDGADDEPSTQDVSLSPQEEAQESEDPRVLGDDEFSGKSTQLSDAPGQEPAGQSERDETASAAAPDGAALSDLMPEPILGPSPVDADATAEEPAATAQLPPGLQKYTSLLGMGSDDGGAEEQLEEPEVRDQVELDQPAFDEETAFGAAEPINVARRLQFEVAFEKTSAPLAQWLRLLSQITGVPISLDIASLDAAGIAPTDAATPTSGWKAAEEVLESLVASAGCTMRKTDGLVVVEANVEAVAAGVEPALRADDLLDARKNAEERQTLAQLIQRVTQAESVMIDPTTSEVSVAGDPSTAWLTALVLDGLRIARQLPPRLPRDRTERWLAIDQGFDWPQVQGGHGIEPIDHPQPIISLVAQVAQANDAVVVFAWSDLWQHGLTPEATAMPWTVDVAGGEVLDRILQPYQLKVRQMSDDLWWVGSQTLYDRDRAIGLIRVPDRAGEITIERLARSLGEIDADELSVAFDEPSGYLVAHLPRFLLRQLPAVVTAGPGESTEAP